MYIRLLVFGCIYLVSTGIVAAECDRKKFESYYSDPELFFATIDNKRSVEEIFFVFDCHNKKIFEVYSNYLRKDASLGGKIVLELEITPEGTVSIAREIDSTIKLSEFKDSLKEIVRTIKFSKKDVQSSKIEFPIVFSPKQYASRIDSQKPITQGSIDPSQAKQYVRDFVRKVYNLANYNRFNIGNVNRDRYIDCYMEVEIEVTVSSDGTIDNIEVTDPSPMPKVDKYFVYIINQGSPFQPLKKYFSGETDKFIFRNHYALNLNLYEGSKVTKPCA